jgi:hypothetical protein
MWRQDFHCQRRNLQVWKGVGQIKPHGIRIHLELLVGIL